MKLRNVKPGDRPMLGGYVVIDVAVEDGGFDATYPVTDARFWTDDGYSAYLVEVRYDDGRTGVLRFPYDPDLELAVIRPPWTQEDLDRILAESRKRWEDDADIFGDP